MICENCGVEHDGTYSSGRFCSEHCSRSFSSRKALEKKNIEKVIICPRCESKFYANYRSPKNIICPSCRTKRFIKTCSVCGSRYIPKNGCGCKNPFCNGHRMQQINTLIKYFGFDKTKVGTPEVENEFMRIRSVLYDLYWNEHKSSSEISKMFGYPSAANLTDKIFRGYMDIPVKTTSYSTSENFLEGRLNPLETGSCNYISGWHKTWNGKDVYLRSSYEFDYAEELDNANIDYGVESIRVKYFDSTSGEYRCAIPDFYLPETNTIVEIKSNWTLDKQNMIDKKKSYIENGYDFKLICEHKELEI